MAVVVSKRRYACYRASFDLLDSIQKAKIFVEKSLENSYKLGSGPGPLGHHL